MMSSEAASDSADSHVVKRVRRQRVQLSCGECRAKKLACDRDWPCQRCVRIGRAHLCMYETQTGQPPIAHQQPQRQQQVSPANDDEVRRLRAEVERLRSLLSNPAPLMTPSPSLPATATATATGSTISEPRAQVIAKKVVQHPKDRTPRGYYAKHSLFKFFVEVHTCPRKPVSLSPFNKIQIPELHPFITESTKDWLEPAGVHLKKDDLSLEQANLSSLDALLPSKDDTDILVTFYLDYCEQLHRVVHVPSFKRQYADFWLPTRSRTPAATALILSIISISASLSSSGTRYRQKLAEWLMTCDNWLKRQGSKCHTLVHYQVHCLVYLAKRLNMIQKKKFWNETGLLVQKAIIDGVYCNKSSPGDDDVFAKEMKRRIWFTIRELDLQNSYEYGLPTLLHNIESDVGSPANVDDETFDETSVTMPPTGSTEHYTRTSYQALSAQSWAVRVAISRRLNSPALTQSLTYEEVLHYTHELTQHLAKLPNWTSSLSKGLHKVTNAVLQFQLIECILALHRPYLELESTQYWLSEDICHRMSRDALLLNLELKELGLQGLVQIREDLLLASLNLTRMIILQPISSTSIITSCSDSTIDLLEGCLPIMESRYLRSCTSEPWCFLTMCATSLIPKVRLGKIDRSTAQYLCAQKFLNLRSKHCQSVIEKPRHDAAESAEAYLTTTCHVPDVGTFADWLNTDLFEFGECPSAFLSGLDNVYG